MILTLSNEKIGTPTKPSRWSNEEQDWVTSNYKQDFLQSVAEVNREIQTIYQCDNLDDMSQHYHLNYMQYLYKCWSDHLGIVVTPDIIWYTLLCEVASLVKQQPEEYRHLFSTYSEKKEIVIPNSDPVVMSLETLIVALKDVVPIETSAFFPEFSTRTLKSFHAFQAAFCDMCSPYYNYSMYLCNIPKVDVKGTLEDWKYLLDKWKKLPICQSNWTQTVADVLNQLVENFNSENFWKTIFSVKHCGSGGQIEVIGWFSKLFREIPRVKYVENFSNHVSIVKYKQINFNKNYKMSVGLFTSKLEDDFMIPDFSLVVHEIC